MKTLGVIGDGDPLVVPSSKVEDKEEQQVAKLARSKEWKPILAEIEERQNAYRQALFGEDMSQLSSKEIGLRFLAARAVINELDVIKMTINQTADAYKQKQ